MSAIGQTAAAVRCRHFVWVICTVQGVALQCVAGVDSSTPNEPSAEQIFSAWRARQNRIRSAKVVWVQDRVDKKGSYSALDKTLGDPFPPEDTAYSKTYTLQLDSDKWRWDMDGAIWNLDRGTLGNRKSSGVWVDGITKRFTDAGEDRGRNGRRIGIYGDMGRDEVVPELTVISASPIAWFLRPFKFKRIALYCGGDEQSGAFAGSEKDLKILRTDGTKGLITCVNLRSKVGAVLLWLDAARDFVVVHAEWSGVQLDIEYLDDAEYGPIPKQWREVCTNANGEEQRVISCRVTDFKLNETVADSVFDPRFPPGTKVQVGHRLLVANASGDLVPASPVDARNAQHSQDD